NNFHWITYVFGAFLVFTGINLLRRPEVGPDAKPLFRTLLRTIPLVQTNCEKFLVQRNGRLLATPLLLSLFLIEISDVVFAMDSIPAIFAITKDPFIVFTSNIFAVLGVRALYSLLASFLVRLRFLHVGLALVLAFVGMKMLLADVVVIPVLASLTV